VDPLQQPSQYAAESEIDLLIEKIPSMREMLASLHEED